MSTASLLIREPLGTRQAAAPLRFGGASADVALPEAVDSFWIDEDAGQWWLRPVPGGVVPVNGVPHREPLVLHDGDVVQLGAAQLVFSAAGPSVEVVHLAGNATVAPLQDEAMPGEVVNPGTAEIRVAGEADATAFPATERVGRRSSLWWWALPAALLAAAVLVLFRLATVPLALTPSTAQVRVPGWFNWRSGDRLFLMPGHHRLQVDAPGYAGRRVDVDAASASGPEASLRIELTLLPDTLVVDTGGVAGDLLLDGQPAGHVPGEVQAVAGSHELSIRAPRHVEYTAKIEVQGGGHKEMVRAQLLPAYGWLVLDTAPSSARVRIDDEDKGTAPLRLELDAGLRHLSIAAPGRRGWNSQVAILAGQTLDLGVVDLSLPAPAAAAGAVTDAASGAAPAAPSTSTPPPPPPSPRIQSALLGAMLLLPAGSFPEGSDRREQGRRSNEVLRQVTLTRPFYLAEREVSNAQFRAFRADHASGMALEKSLDLDNQAVSNVSWNDAVEFCNWLSLREGLPAAYERRDGRWQLVQPRNHGYRLPSEAEWEYAARYVDGQRWRRYAWGDSLPPPSGAANLGGQESLPPKPGPETRLAAAMPGYRDEHAVVAPIGSYARTAAGFYDFGGNVSEWTHDVYTSMPEAEAVTDPFGPDSDGPHAVRGANWRTTSIAELRLAWRDRAAGPSQTVGFRVARYVEAP